MHRPVKAKHDPETGLVDLRFVQDEDCQREKVGCSVCENLKEVEKFGQRSIDVSYYIRGAIVWPLGKWPGYVLVSGQDQQKKEIWIFEEGPFWSVSNMEFEKGIWSFFHEMWEKYHCQCYYHADSKEHRRYSIQVQRESLLKQKPHFIEAKYATKSKDNADNLIQEYADRGRVRIDRERPMENNFNVLSGNLGTQLESFIKGCVEDEDSLPAVKALRALVAGYERVQYQKPSPPQEPPESYFR